MTLAALDLTKHRISSTWELEATCSHSQILVPGKKLNVVWISATREKKDGWYIQQNVEGCVCICNSSDPKVVAKVQHEALLCRALALFTLAKPLTGANFPVFVVNDIFIQTTLYATSSFVVFELHDPSTAKVEIHREGCRSGHPPVHHDSLYNATVVQTTKADVDTRMETADLGQIDIRNYLQDKKLSYATVVGSDAVGEVGVDTKHLVRFDMNNYSAFCSVSIIVEILSPLALPF